MTVEKVIEHIRLYCCGEQDSIVVLDGILEEYMQNSLEYRKHNGLLLARKVVGFLIENESNLEDYYYLFSFLFQANEDINLYKDFLQSCIEDEYLDLENRFFVYQQCNRYNFLNTVMVDDEVKSMMDILYSNTYEMFLNELKDDLVYIPKEDRNEDFVVVFTTQVLNEGHAPTKTLIDRCAVLERTMNKKVFIINTAELMTFNGAIKMFRMCTGRYVEEYSDVNKLPIRNYEFDFFQCPNTMPQIPIIKEIISVIKSEKPYFILTIGGNSVVSDICSKIVPTITIGTVFSGRAVTRGQFQAIGRKINDEDRAWLSLHGYEEDHIIESFFTFVFKEQKHIYTKKQLKFPDNRFVVALIGGRLGEEVDDKCTELLIKLVEKGAFITLIGVFDHYKEYVEKYPQLKGNSSYLGFQDDVLAILDHCDLYVNPKRKGGGSSASEALFKGVPVVSMNYGDVAVAVGSDFCVSDWKEMQEKCVQYMEDKEYYKMMSQKAQERAALLTDSDTAFVKIIEEAEKRKGFQ